MDPNLGQDVKLGITQGDCLVFLKSMPDKCVDIVVMSPPYNQLGNRIPDHPTGMHVKNFKKVINHGYSDDMTEPDYQSWIREVVSECLRVSKGLVWVNHKTRYRDRVAIHPLQFLPFPLYSEVIWNRKGSMVLNAKKFAPSFEYVFGFGTPHYWDNAANVLMSVWNIPVSSDLTTETHPCPFPVEIPLRLIRASCPPGGIVLDPFMGSGTTALAAERSGRKHIGFEISSDYIAIAKRRIESQKQRSQIEAEAEMRFLEMKCLDTGPAQMALA